MAAIDDLLQRDRRDRHILAPWLAAIFIVTAVIWANFARLDEVASASGRVVPVGQVKVIQHLEGGIVEKLLVVDGRKVKAGDALIELNLGLNKLNYDEVRVQLDGLQLSRARLLSMANEKPLELPPALAKKYSDLARNERQLYRQSKRELESRLAGIGDRAAQRDREIREYQAQAAAVRQDLRLAREKVAIAEALRKDKLISKMEYLKLEQEVQRLRGQLSILWQSVAKARAAGSEVSQTRREVIARFKRELNEDLNRNEREIARLKERLRAAGQQADRAVIRSPIDGIVQNLKYHTIGGVVRPGDPVMEIVPLSEKMIVEMLLNPVDRGYVKVGQSATVKVTSYDFIRYGSLTGKVVRIAADTNISDQGQAYYKVVVETTSDFKGPDGQPLPIEPGMETMVDINTGDRTVLQYLIRPVLKLKSEAFRER